MKKLLVLAAACMLVLGIAGHAGAYFVSGDLIGVMYDASTGVEVATDLGSIGTLSGQTNVKGDSISLSTFNDTTWSDVNVAYFAYNSSTNTLYVAGSGNPSIKLGANQAINFFSTAGSIESYYSSLGTISGTTSSALGSTGNANSYQTSSTSAAPRRALSAALWLQAPTLIPKLTQQPAARSTCGSLPVSTPEAAPPAR